MGILVVRLGNEVGTPAALLAPHVEGADLGDGESVHGLEAAADVHLGGGGDSPDGELLHGRQRGWGSGRFAKWITRRPNRLVIAVGGGWGWSGRGGRGLRRAAADRWEGEQGEQGAKRRESPLQHVYLFCKYNIISHYNFCNIKLLCIRIF